MTLTSEAFQDELTDFGDEPVEFYTDTSGLSPLQRRLNIQAVPRKYTSGMPNQPNIPITPTPPHKKTNFVPCPPQGQCTLTIAMLADFKSGDIPGFDPSTRFLPYRDVSAYHDISTVAHFMLGRCIAVGQMGWFVVGT